MVGPAVDDEAVTLPTQMGLVHDPPNLSVPQNFDSPDGFMEDDGFNGPYKKDGPDGKGRSFQGSWRRNSHGSTTTRPRIVPSAAGAIGACRKRNYFRSS